MPKYEGIELHSYQAKNPGVLHPSQQATQIVNYFEATPKIVPAKEPVLSKDAKKLSASIFTVSAILLLFFPLMRLLEDELDIKFRLASGYTLAGGIFLLVLGTCITSVMLVHAWIDRRQNHD
jgi:hypothetical protein